MAAHAADFRAFAALVAALNDLALLVRGYPAGDVLGQYPAHMHVLGQYHAWVQAGGQVGGASAVLAAPLVAAEGIESDHVAPAFHRAFQRA